MVTPGDLTITQIREIVSNEETPEQFIALCRTDRRQGVRQLAQSYYKAREKREAEDLRLEKLFVFEDKLWQQGYLKIAGIDEAGRGPLAGPVVAAAVILPGKLKLSGLNDSKQVTEARRNDLARQIRHQAEAWSIGTSSVEEIDEFNILGATKLAMVRAVQALGLTADYLLIDGNQGIKMKVRQQTVVDGDCLSASIAAASILAKVYRDELMNRLHKDYPCYNFAANKGYLTKEHASALKRFGACPIHRKSFAPIKAV